MYLFYIFNHMSNGLPWWLRWQRIFRRPGLIPGQGRSLGEGNSYPLEQLLHGQRSLAGYSPWGHKELDMTEQLTNSVREFQEIQRQVSKKMKKHLHSHSPEITAVNILLCTLLVFVHIFIITSSKQTCHFAKHWMIRQKL